MKTKKITLLGIAITLAMIMSYIESLFPLSFAVPGIKMGLANIVIIFVLYKMSTLDAIIVSITRIFLVSLLFGNVMTLAYSISGAVLSLLFMVMLKSTEKFSTIGVSVTGAIMHNIGQILMAMLLLETQQIIYYLPALLISGIVTGILIGTVSAIVIKRIEKI